MVDYACTVWNPKHAVHQAHLERVQSFAAKVVTKCWSVTPSILISNLRWPSLQARRSFQQLCACNRILKGDSIIPPTVFMPHPRPTRVHANSKPLFQVRTRTAHHRSSFFHSVVPLWNALPDKIVGCQSQLGFKRALRAHHFNR